MREYYVVQFLLKKKTYCIWYSDNEDGFLTENNKIKIFKCSKELKLYCDNLGIEISDNISGFDILALNQSMLTNKISSPSLYLDFWNITHDAMKSIKMDFSGDHQEYLPIYDKLFFSLNLLKSKQEKFEISN